MSYADFIFHPRHNQTAQEVAEGYQVVQNHIQDVVGRRDVLARAYAEKMKREAETPRVNQSAEEVLAADRILLAKINETAEEIAARAQTYFEVQKESNV